MKKIIAILLCTILMLSCLAAVAESGVMPWWTNVKVNAVFEL